MALRPKHRKCAATRVLQTETMTLKKDPQSSLDVLRFTVIGFKSRKVENTLSCHQLMMFLNVFFFYDP